MILPDGSRAGFLERVDRRPLVLHLSPGSVPESSLVHYAEIGRSLHPECVYAANGIEADGDRWRRVVAREELRRRNAMEAPASFAP